MTTATSRANAADDQAKTEKTDTSLYEEIQKKGGRASIRRKTKIQLFFRFRFFGIECGAENYVESELKSVVRRD